MKRPADLIIFFSLLAAFLSDFFCHRLNLWPGAVALLPVLIFLRLPLSLAAATACSFGLVLDGWLPNVPFGCHGFLAYFFVLLLGLLRKYLRPDCIFRFLFFELVFTAGYYCMMSCLCSTVDWFLFAFEFLTSLIFNTLCLSLFLYDRSCWSIGPRRNVGHLDPGTLGRGPASPADRS